jgi:hypothetical protein
MPNLLVGTAYAVSAGLIIYSIQAELAPEEFKFPLIIAWAIAGLLISFAAIWRRTDKTD